ncbi:MAG: hypothetical protein F6K47_22485 [Symploca sp. SIO2E6]|nr:hypothetical protein [Symploca sp. SIO2E6]
MGIGNWELGMENGELLISHFSSLSQYCLDTLQFLSPSSPSSPISPSP